MPMVKLLKLTHMMLSALRRILMIQIRMLSVIVVNTTTLKRVQFTLERDTITQVRADLLAGILILENQENH